MLLNLNKFLFIRKIKRINELNQDEIDVDIGIIMNPILSK
tara:strand:+ start:308 stop:427 length:120 start_codon:yes stop_codon:yes gene_type:complete